MPKVLPLPTLVDRLTPDALCGAFAEQALAEGRNAVERGRVSRPDVRPARADAVVVGADRHSHRARLALRERLSAYFDPIRVGGRREGYVAIV